MIGLEFQTGVIRVTSMSRRLNMLTWKASIDEILIDQY